MNTELINTFRALESKLQLLFNNMNEGVALHKLVFDKKGKVIDYIIEKVNPSYERILKVKKENVEGKSSTEVYGTAKPPYLKEFSTVALTGKPYGFEPYFAPLEKHFSISVSPWGENGFATIFTDITDKKRIEKQLMLKNFVFNSTISANSISDVNGIIIDANAAFLEIWGYHDVSQVIGKPISHFLKNEKEASSIKQALDTQGKWHGNYTAIREDGSTFCAFGLATILTDEEGNFIGYQSSVCDVTESKEAEEQINALLNEKELLLKELHHRVTNSISAINNLLYLQAESINNPEAASILKDARNRLKSMGLLHKKLYKSSSLQACDAKDYFSQLIDEILSAFPEGNKIKIEKNLESFELSHKFLFPLGIIINELLTNTMKHAFSDTKNAYIKTTLSHKEDNLTLIVEDNGKGIPEDKIKNSNGFGMSLVSLLAEQLKGTLTVERHKGSRFILSFNL